MGRVVPNFIFIGLEGFSISPLSKFPHGQSNPTYGIALTFCNPDPELNWRGKGKKEVKVG